MRPRPTVLLESVLCGYGQLFLCPDPRSGMLFLAALLLASPAGGLWSLGGALGITLCSLPFRPAPAILRTGLFAVNGILLGLAWAWFPEVDLLPRLLALGGALLTGGALLAISSRRWHIRQSPITLLSLPYVLLLWLLLALLPLFKAYDLHQFRGWRLLAEGQPQAAALEFGAAQFSGARGQAHRHDGLAWSRYRQGDPAGAAWHFGEAIALDSSFADAWDGLAWSEYALGDVERARSDFQQALRLDPQLASSRDGLGWLALAQGDAVTAEGFFCGALCAAPLLVDAWHGLQQSWQAQGKTAPAARAERVARVLQESGLPQPALVSSRQLVAWLLMALAVWLHSPLSGGVLTAALLLPSLLGLTGIPVPHSVDFYFNLTAFALALGGHYLPPGRWAWLALLLLLPAFTLLWAPLEAAAWTLGLPLLNLPFNLAMLAVLAGLAALQRGVGSQLLVPLEIAVRRPADVKIWALRAQTAKACWQAIDRTRPR